MAMIHVAPCDDELIISRGNAKECRWWYPQLMIKPTMLGEFVCREWHGRWHEPTASDSDARLLRRLREEDLVRSDVSDADLIAVFVKARQEHLDDGVSEFNSPWERVRVFLDPYLSKKGESWAGPAPR